jgi:hypothetical protein
VKASINTNHASFTDFDSVKDAYVEFKHTQAPTHDLKTRQVASVAHGGRGGGDRSHQQGHGHGPQTSDACQKGLVPQAEIDKQTHITLRYYSNDKFNRLTPTEKQKLWQLKNPGKTLGTGPTRHDRNSTVASTSITSSGCMGKCQVEDSAIKSDQPADDQKWGRNQENPALGRQGRPCGDDN